MSIKILEKIFSIKNSTDNSHKICKFFVFKFKFKIKKKHLKGEPFGLIIDTTILCNNNCSFCWRSNNPEHLALCNKKFVNKSMNFDIFKKIIDDACQYESIKWFTCCGPMGEPLLNENVENFYEYAYNKQHFNSITINTNGLAIDKKNISKLLNSINEFSISIDSIDEDTYYKIHGNKNLSKLINNIKELINYKKQHGALANIVVRFTENKFNKGQIEEFIEYFKNLGVDGVNYTQEHSFAGVNKQITDETGKINCRHPNEIINFDFQGNMATCCLNWHLTPVFGNIKNKTIKQLWESSQKQSWNNKKRFNSTPCKECSGAENKIKNEIRSNRIMFNPRGK